MIITDTTNNDLLFPFARGLVPRDYNTHPVGYEASIPPLQIKTIPKSDWSAICKERKRLKNTLTQVRRMCGPNGGRIPSLQQNSKRYNGRWGFCWTHSATMANMLVRAKMGLSYVKLSAFMVASIINKYQDKGGWGANACAFIEKYGQPPCEGVNGWQEDVVDPSRNTAEMMKLAAMYKISLSWADLANPVYARNLNRAQHATLLLMGVPVIADRNWWGHSTVDFDWEEIEPGSFGPRGLNSWGDEWGQHGEYVIQGVRGDIDGGVAPLVALAA